MNPNPPKYANGAKVGKLTILKYVGHGTLQGRKSHIYRVRCDCGAIVHRSQFTLTYNERQGYQTSCGCSKGESIDHGFTLQTHEHVGTVTPTRKPLNDITLAVGDIIGGTELLKEVALSDRRYTRAGFQVRCECGRTTTKKAYDLKKAKAEGLSLRCRRCTLKAARKDEDEDTEAEPTSGFDYEALRKSQDWGYAPR